MSFAIAGFGECPFVSTAGLRSLEELTVPSLSDTLSQPYMRLPNLHVNLFCNNISFSVFYTLIRGNNYSFRDKTLLKILEHQQFYSFDFLCFLFHFLVRLITALFFNPFFILQTPFFSHYLSCILLLTVLSFSPEGSPAALNMLPSDMSPFPTSSCLNPATNFSSNSWDFCIVLFQLQY